jgi:sulfide dehydrogenase cytochrome subunit
MVSRILIGCLSVMLANLALAAGEDDLSVFMLASSCSACHGPQGASPGAIPPLQGKSSEFIELALTEYRSGASQSTVMGRLAKGYSVEEIKQIAHWYGRRE